MSDEEADDRYIPRHYCQNFTDIITVLVGNAAHIEAANDEAPLYPVEGQFESIADRSYVLGLPEIEREEILAKRASHVTRRQQDLKLKGAPAAAKEGNENHKKRKVDAELEDDTLRTTEGRQFTVHKDLICANSKFSEAACSKLWAEGKEKVVRLPEVKVGTFEAYLVWVYSRKVVVNTAAIETASKASVELRRTINLYLLGDVLDDLRLRNAAMRSLITKSTYRQLQPGPTTINRVWNSTPPGSHLRQMIVDMTVMRFSREGFEMHSAHYPKDALQAIAIALMHKVAVLFHDTFVAGLDGYLEPEVSGKPEKVK